MGWQPGSGLDLKFRVDDPGFPLPMKPMVGGWRLDDRGADGTRVTVWWSFTTRPVWAAPLMVPLMDARMQGSMAKVIRSMGLAASAPTSRTVSPEPARGRLRARLQKRGTGRRRGCSRAAGASLSADAASALSGLRRRPELAGGVGQRRLSTLRWLAGWLAGWPTPGQQPRPERVVESSSIVGSNPLINLFDPEGWRPMVRNFDTIAPIMLGHLRRAARDPPAALGTLRQLEDFGLPLGSASHEGLLPLVIPLRLSPRKNEEISLFSTMTMMGTATDVVISTLRLETYFPADEAADELLRSIAEGRCSDSSAG